MTDQVDDDGDDEFAGEKKAYRNPPEQHRFKPGQSGNPRGRPHGRRGFKTDLTELVGGAYGTAMRNGKVVTITVQQQLLRTLRTKALSGNLAAMDKLVQLIITHIGVEDIGTKKAAFSAKDEALLNGILGAVTDPHNDGDEPSFPINSGVQEENAEDSGTDAACERE